MLKTELPEEVNVWKRIGGLRQNSVTLLAPGMQSAVQEFLAASASRAVTVPATMDGLTEIPLDVIVFETLRTNELQEIYFEQGTTNAQTSLWSWHGYGLAIDAISKQFEWFSGSAAKRAWPAQKDRHAAANAWFLAMGELGEAHRMKWGGRWKRPDLPHLQWARCRATPSNRARELHAAGGIEAVQREVGAA